MSGKWLRPGHFNLFQPPEYESDISFADEPANFFMIAIFLFFIEREYYSLLFFWRFFFVFFFVRQEVVLRLETPYSGVSEGDESIAKVSSEIKYFLKVKN